MEKVVIKEVGISDEKMKEIEEENKRAKEEMMKKVRYEYSQVRILPLRFAGDYFLHSRDL